MSRSFSFWPAEPLIFIVRAAGFWKFGAMTTLLIATRNAHKVGEIRAVFAGGFKYLTLQDFPAAPTVNEDAATFAGNATKKSVQLARWLGRSQPANSSPQPGSTLFVLADDSGLEVDALGGAPGVYS